MAQHSSYWSNSKLADWVRGTKKISVGTFPQWDDWEKQAKVNSPIRYWIVETAFDAAQDFVTWPVRKLYDIKYYINNRWVTSTHSLRAHPKDIKRGSWCDVGNRFLPCLFNELVDFVEVETAWHQIAWNSEERHKYNAPFYAWGWLRWRTWRCKQAGLDHLDWAMALTAGDDWGLKPGDANYGKPTDQAIRAKEIKELYTWWTEVYPHRPDPYEVSGWSALCERRRQENNGSILSMSNDRTPQERKESSRILKVISKIEAQYEREDTEMMVRLIKVRNALWT